MPRKSPQAQAARNNPVRSAPRETNTADFAVPQRGPIDVDQALHNSPAGIELAEKMPDVAHADLLQFAEDPVTVVLNGSSDPKASKLMHCAVNGIGAEVWDHQNKRWVKFTWLPVNRVITVKRKCLEVLGRSRVDTYATREITTTPQANQDGFMLESNTIQTAPFMVRHDPAGARGEQWLSQILREF